MKGARSIVQKVLDKADLIIEVLDARYPEETRNYTIEREIQRRRKPLIFVLNKADLLHKPFVEVHFPEKLAVFVAATKNLGTTKLRNLLRTYIKNKPLIVGIIGYPNTGKSSLINVLKQRKSAPTSPIAGYTRGVQNLRIAKNMYMLDTPGVFAPDDHDQIKHALTSTLSITQIKDPELIALKILDRIREENNTLTGVYDVPWNDDLEALLENIALHFHFLKKGGKPDGMRAARKIIEDWQHDKFARTHYS